MEDYVHRIGRTGRAGLTGQATSFYTDQDLVPSSPYLCSLLVNLPAVQFLTGAPLYFSSLWQK